MTTFMGDDVYGEMEGDDVAADLLGAVDRGLSRGGGMRMYRRPVAKRPPLPAGEMRPDARIRSYMGVGITSWAATDPTGTLKTLTVEPQESFRGERLIIDTIAAGGTSASLVVVNGVFVGTMPQSPSVEQPAPSTMFARDATIAGLDLQIAHRGTKFSVQLSNTAPPGTGVTLTAVVGVYGEWIR